MVPPDDRSRNAFRWLACSCLGLAAWLFFDAPLLRALHLEHADGFAAVHLPSNTTPRGEAQVQADHNTTPRGEAQVQADHSTSPAPRPPPPPSPGEGPPSTSSTTRRPSPGEDPPSTSSTTPRSSPGQDPPSTSSTTLRPSPGEDPPSTSSSTTRRSGPAPSRAILRPPAAAARSGGPRPGRAPRGGASWPWDAKRHGEGSRHCEPRICALKRERARNLTGGCGLDGRHSRSYSQSFEDLVVQYAYFCGVRRGTYVEMGALDGRFLSNTVLFEEGLGWTGLLIEANPANAAKLAKNRPGNRQFHLAACPEGVGNLTFIGKAGSGVGGALSTMAAAHLARWNRDAPNFTVPCRPLGLMLAEAGVAYVDFFSLDVEGGELAVLQTMDWGVQVCVWMVELDGRNRSKDGAVVELLESKGYIRSPINLRQACDYISSAPRLYCTVDSTIFEHRDLSTCGTRNVGRTGDT